MKCVPFILKTFTSSCFLLTLKGDTREGIYETLKQCALISKSAGGVGINIHCMKSKGCKLPGTNAVSNGIVPTLRVFNSTARYVDQGGNKVCVINSKEHNILKNSLVCFKTLLRQCPSTAIICYFNIIVFIHPIFLLLLRLMLSQLLAF